ncbi:MAG: PAS domain-containing protein [Deltaproteobacteria bacterium]|nr:PAS domain-containing protein [Deltaproteobacteria bacterium]
MTKKSTYGELEQKVKELEKEAAKCKLIEERLQENENKYRTLLENLPQKIFQKDTDLVYVSCNENFAQDLKIKPEEFKGKTDFKFFPEELAEKYRADDMKIITSGKTEDIEEKYLRDGQEIWVQTLKTPIKDKKGNITGLLGIFWEITERKRMEEALLKARDELEERVKERTAELSKANEELQAEIIERKRTRKKLKRYAFELERSNQELQHFAYVASHDLQEPLRMVASYTQLLAKRYKGRLDSDADEFIAYAVDGATRMQVLINDLLSYSRVGTKGKDFRPTDCGTVLEHTLDNLKQVIEESGVEVTYNPLPTVIADDMQLGQLFQNLIANAIRFRSKDSPHIHVSAERNEDKWIFSVRDNGIGIDPEFHKRIFVIFQRLHKRGEYPGTGIGLAVCNKIVERHAGRIWVESNPKEGSTFYFTIPLKGGISHE